MREFVAGGSFLAAAMIAPYFLVQWTRSRDRLFLAFGLAFAVLAIHYFLLPFFLPSAEDEPAVYAIRLVAFGLIIAGVVDKNRVRSGRP
jgi:type IV secretory pathway component VirB8